MATCVEKVKQALIAFLSLEGKAREAVFELDIAALNSKDGMERVYEKLDTLFLEDINQSAFLAYETFKGYWRQPDTSIEDFLINFKLLIKPFWLDFKHGVLEWKASEIKPTSDDEQTFGDEENIMISSSDQNLETAKKEELQNWVKNKVHP